MAENTENTGEGIIENPTTPQPNIISDGDNDAGSDIKAQLKAQFNKNLTEGSRYDADGNLKEGEDNLVIETPDEEPEEINDITPEITPDEELEEEIEKVKETSQDDDDEDLLGFLDDDESTDEEPEEEETNDRETNIVKLRKSKEELQARYDQQEEILQSKVEELEKLEQELEGYQYSQIDPKTHPDFKNKSEATANSIDSKLVKLRNIPDVDKISENWGDFLTDVAAYENTPRGGKVQALADLRLSVAQKIGLVPSDVTELDPEIDGGAMDAADKVIDVFAGHTSDYNELANIYQNIQTKASSKTLEIGYDEYQRNTEPVRSALATIDTLSDNDIMEDPDSIQSLAAKKIKESSSARTKAAQIDKALIELGFGEEALSQEELDRHEKSGKDMEEFHRKRSERVKKIRETMLPQFKAFLLLKPQIEEALPNFFNNNDKAKKLKNSKATVGRVSKTKPAPTPKKEEPKTTTSEALREKMRSNLR